MSNERTAAASRGQQSHDRTPSRDAAGLQRRTTNVTARDVRTGRPRDPHASEQVRLAVQETPETPEVRELRSQSRQAEAELVTALAEQQALAGIGGRWMTTRRGRDRAFTAGMVEALQNGTEQDLPDGRKTDPEKARAAFATGAERSSDPGVRRLPDVLGFGHLSQEQKIAELLNRDRRTLTVDELRDQLGEIQDLTKDIHEQNDALRDVLDVNGRTAKLPSLDQLQRASTEVDNELDRAVLTLQQDEQVATVVRSSAARLAELEKTGSVDVSKAVETLTNKLNTTVMKQVRDVPREHNPRRGVRVSQAASIRLLAEELEATENRYSEEAQLLRDELIDHYEPARAEMLNQFTEIEVANDLAARNQALDSLDRGQGKSLADGRETLSSTSVDGTA